MANTTKGSGKTKKKTSASGTAKKKQTQTTARKTTVKKSSTAKRTSGTRKNTVREPMDEGVRAEIILLSVLAVSILLMLSNFGMGGVIGQAVCDFFFGLFGVTEWAAPVLIFFGSAASSFSALLCSFWRPAIREIRHFWITILTAPTIISAEES